MHLCVQAEPLLYVCRFVTLFTLTGPELFILGFSVDY